MLAMLALRAASILYLSWIALRFRTVVDARRAAASLQPPTEIVTLLTYWITYRDNLLLVLNSLLVRLVLLVVLVVFAVFVALLFVFGRFLRLVGSRLHRIRHDRAGNRVNRHLVDSV